jgi:hypothetical protein
MTRSTPAGRANPSAWNAGATPLAVSSLSVTFASSASPDCIRANELCCVASARPEKPPQHNNLAISSIADGARYARYFPGASDLAGRLISASRSRASDILRSSAGPSQAKPAQPDLTALSAR